MKHVMNHVAPAQVGVVHASAGTGAVQHGAQRVHEGRFAFRICSEEESWIQAGETFIHTVATRIIFKDPAFGSEGF